MVAELQTLLGVTVPIQFSPVMVLVSAMFLIFITAFVAEILKNIIL